MCVCVCLSVTKRAATYLVCESKVRRYKDPYCVPNAWFVWISPKTLCSPVLASYADSKLLNFSRASDSLTLRINETLCVVHYIRYVRIINPRCMRFRHGSQRWSPLPPWSTGEHLTIMGWRWLFFQWLRICMFSCHAMCILVVPLTLWLARLVAMHAWHWATCSNNIIVLDMQYCSVYSSLAPRFCIRVRAFKMFWRS